MMVLERATAPGSAAPCSEQNNQAESTTPEPATCGTCKCKAAQDLYILAGGFLCVGCIGIAVSMAASFWPEMVRYSRELEEELYD